VEVEQVRYTFGVLSLVEGDNREKRRRAWVKGYAAEWAAGGEGKKGQRGAAACQRG
jgi:hypothetical protein